jgi:hypothetical protein
MDPNLVAITENQMKTFKYIIITSITYNEFLAAMWFYLCGGGVVSINLYLWYTLYCFVLFATVCVLPLKREWELVYQAVWVIHICFCMVVSSAVTIGFNSIWLLLFAIMLHAIPMCLSSVVIEHTLTRK